MAGELDDVGLGLGGEGPEGGEGVGLPLGWGQPLREPRQDPPRQRDVRRINRPRAPRGRHDFLWMNTSIQVGGKICFISEQGFDQEVSSTNKWAPGRHAGGGQEGPDDGEEGVGGQRWGLVRVRVHDPRSWGTKGHTRI